MHFIESSIKCFDLSLQILMLHVQVAQSRSSFEKLISNNPLCFLEILHYFRSTICQPHILIRNSILLPLTSLEIQVSHKLCINPIALIITSKRTSNSEMLTPVLRRIAGALHTYQHLSGLTKPSGCITYNLSSRKPSRKQCIDFLCAIFHK